MGCMYMRSLVGRKGYGGLGPGVGVGVGVVGVGIGRNGVWCRRVLVW